MLLLKTRDAINLTKDNRTMECLVSTWHPRTVIVMQTIGIMGMRCMSTHLSSLQVPLACPPYPALLVAVANYCHLCHLDRGHPTSHDPVNTVALAHPRGTIIPPIQHLLTTLSYHSTSLSSLCPIISAVICNLTLTIL